MSDYRWNTDDAARAYDSAAMFIHPHYLEIHDRILRQICRRCPERALVVDLGGGSGRLIERILMQLPTAEGVVVDQSAASLALAEQRLGRFGNRAKFLPMSLQADWTAALSRPANAIVSTSAIHHLEPSEKQALFRRCQNCLAPGGVFLNGDEARPESDADYLAELRRWHAQMEGELAAGLIPNAFRETLDQWRRRNIDGFSGPRQSGDDCHETVDTQLGYLHAARFMSARVLWQRGLWAIVAADR
jgi:SAM-dependent methyltransferase